MSTRPPLKLSRLRDIGWREWDPIGLLPRGDRWEDYPEFADEYDSYLLQAAGQLRRDCPSTDVINYLVSIESEHMGVGPLPSALSRAEATVTAIQKYLNTLSNSETPEETTASRLRTNWFSSVWELSNLSLQRRRWLDPQNRNPHWSYIEFVESYPDADQLADARSRGWLTAQEFALLQELQFKLLSHFAADDHDNAAVLANPAWRKIIEAAELTRQGLLSTVESQSEREALLAGTISGA